MFIDHNAHLTTFIDPRLPYAGNEGLAGSKDATPAPSEIQVCTCTVDRVTFVFSNLFFLVCTNLCVYMRAQHHTMIHTAFLEYYIFGRAVNELQFINYLCTCAVLH